LKRQMFLAATLAMAATALNADVIAPDDVMTNEYGDVGESLTGMPGNVDRGREVMFIAESGQLHRLPPGHRSRAASSTEKSGRRSMVWARGGTKRRFVVSS
jgi:hypothetical protein